MKLLISLAIVLSLASCAQQEEYQPEMVVIDDTLQLNINSSLLEKIMELDDKDSIVIRDAGMFFVDKDGNFHEIK